MKTLILIASLFIVTAGHAQTVTKDAQGNYHATAKTDSAKATGKTFTDSKGNTYPVFVSRNGKLFYLRTSKSGNIYKAYLKVN